MKILFMGTPEIAVPTLAALNESGKHSITALTQADKPRGRGMRITPSAVKSYALEKGLAVLQPKSVKDEVFLEEIEKQAFDLIVVVSFGQIMPERLIRAGKLGAINSHFSLLPKLRGAAPINRAIMNGDAETGVTIQHIEYKLDTGDIIAQEKTGIGPEENAGELGARLAAMSARLMLLAVDLIEGGSAVRMPQDGSKATFARKITGEELFINWSMEAVKIRDHVRGLAPVPGASACLDGRIIKVLKCAAGPALSKKMPGTVISAGKDGLEVASGCGSIRILEIKPEGKRLMSAGEYTSGHKGLAGKVFSALGKESCSR